MAGFRLTPPTAGCPPTETPITAYDNPFREDENGALWIKRCFPGFKYFGAARQDSGNGIPQIIGDGPVLLTPPGGMNNTVNGISSGRFRNLTITNETNDTLAIITSLDLLADLTVRSDHIVSVAVQVRWNGQPISYTAVSTLQIYNSTKHVRQSLTVSANPHDPNIEVGGAPSMSLASGESGVVSARIHLTMGDNGIPTGTEVVNNFSSAVRVYGHFR